MGVEYMTDGNGAMVPALPVPVPAPTVGQPNIAPDGSMRLEDFVKQQPNMGPGVGVLPLNTPAHSASSKRNAADGLLSLDQVMGRAPMPAASGGLVRLDSIRDTPAKPAGANNGLIPLDDLLARQKQSSTPAPTANGSGLIALDDLLKQQQANAPTSRVAADGSMRLEDFIKQGQAQDQRPQWQQEADQYIDAIQAKHGPMSNPQKLSMLEWMRMKAGAGGQSPQQMAQQVQSASAETNTPMQNFGMPILQGEVGAGETLLHPFNSANRLDAIQGVQQATQTPADSKAAMIGSGVNFGMQMLPMLAPGVGQAYAAGQGMAGVANEAEAQREAGRKVSGWKEAGDMAVQAALAAATGPMSKGIGNMARPVLAKFLGEAAAPVLSRYLGSMSAADVMQIGNNLADRVSGVDPDRHPLEGVGQATLGGALAHGATELAGAHAASPEGFTPDEQRELGQRLAGLKEPNAQQGSAHPETPEVSESSQSFQSAQAPNSEKTAPVAPQAIQTTADDSGAVSPLLARLRASGAGRSEAEASSSTPESQPLAKSPLLDRAKAAQIAQPITDADRQAYLSPGEKLTDENRADIDRAIQRVRVRDANATSPAASPNGEPAGGAGGNQIPGARRGAVAIPGALAKPVEELGRLASNSPDENGRTPFQDRSGVQATAARGKNMLSNMRESWNAVNRFLGTGLGETEQSKGTGERVAASLANADRDRIQAEARLKPARDAMEGWSDKAKELWINQIEAGQPSPDPKTQEAANLIRQQNAQLEKRAAAVGMDTSKWNGDWIGRLAEWPGEKGNGNRSSLAGNENYLKGRKLDTFSDFKKAVEETGGRLKYDNPLDMYLAKNLEANRSITARELLQGEQQRGSVKPFDRGSQLPEGWKWLDDKLAGQGPSRYSAEPKIAAPLNDNTTAAADRVAKFRQLRDSGALNELKPGQEFPKGHMVVDPTLSKLADNQRLAAPAPVADKLNQFIAAGIGGRGIPVWDQWVNFKRQSAAINFALSGWHLTTSTLRNAGVQMGTAMDALAHGQFGLAAKNAWRANPLAQMRFGRQLQDAAAAAKDVPGLEPLVKAAEEGGSRFNRKSYVTDPTPMQKAVTAYKNGNGAAAGYHLMRGIAHASTNLIMDKYVAPIKVGIMGNIAALEMAKGVTSPDELRAKMNGASSTVDNVMGMIVRDNQFQHKVVTDLMDGLFAAPKFFEGDIRFAGQTAIDTAKALGSLATGKKPTLTRPMYTAMGLLTAHAMTSAMMQMAMTAYHSGGTPTAPESLNDLFYPRTGKKNADGTDERLTLPDLGFIPSEIAGIANGHSLRPVFNRIEPILRAAADVASNSDYRNVQVREGGLGQQVAQSAEHIGKSMLPFTVENAINRPSNQQAPGMMERVGNFVGIQRAPTAVTQSDAMQTARDLIDQRGGNPVRTQEQEAKYNMEQGLVNRIRSRDKSVVGDIEQMEETGKLSHQDFKDLVKRSEQAPGLPSLVASPRLNVDDLMQIWDKATPDERMQIWETVGKRVLSPSTPYLKSKRYAQQLRNDLAAIRAARAENAPAASQ